MQGHTREDADPLAAHVTMRARRPRREPATQGGLRHLPILRGSSQRRGERGVAMVEFTLVVPLFLVLLFAIIDFGRAYSAYVTITNAAREGARDGVTGDTQANIISTVKNTAGPYNDANLSVSVTGAQGSTGSNVVVTTTYNLQFITPLAALAKLAKSSFTLTSTSQMRIE